MQNTNNVQPFEHYEESRKYPRIKVWLPVQLIIEGGQSVSGHIYDISPDGLQIRCSREIAGILNPGGKQIDKKHKPSVKVVFTWPMDNEPIEISVLCDLFYFVLVQSETVEDVAFGLRFKDFEGQSVAFLGKHILNELEPLN